MTTARFRGHTARDALSPVCSLTLQHAQTGGHRVMNKEVRRNCRRHTMRQGPTAGERQARIMPCAGGASHQDRNKLFGVAPLASVDTIRRQPFIASLAGAILCLAGPLAAWAQPQTTPVIGFLHSDAPDRFAHIVAAFRKGLAETGYVEGRNVAIEFRWAENRYERLPGLAAELVGRRVTVIVALGGTVSAQAAKAATATIPIVFATADDTVRAGLVASLSRPEGNLTGIGHLLATLEKKRLEILHKLVPAAQTIAVLVNPKRPTFADQLKDLRAAAHALGLTLRVVNASDLAGLEAAFAGVARERLRAMAVASDSFFLGQRELMVGLAARYAVPVIYPLRGFVMAGGLISYGTSITDAIRQVGVYTGRILHGAKPADLPIMRPTKFDLAINLKTAKALGLDVPLSLQVAADEVID